MKPLDYVIIAVVAVWFVLAVRSILRHRGGCSCGGSAHGCSGCSMSSGTHGSSGCSMGGGTHGCGGCSMNDDRAGSSVDGCGKLVGCCSCPVQDSKSDAGI